MTKTVTYESNTYGSMRPGGCLNSVAESSDVGSVNSNCCQEPTFGDQSQSTDSNFPQDSTLVDQSTSSEYVLQKQTWTNGQSTLSRCSHQKKTNSNDQSSLHCNEHEYKTSAKYKSQSVDVCKKCQKAIKEKSLPPEVRLFYETADNARSEFSTCDSRKDTSPESHALTENFATEDLSLLTSLPDCIVLLILRYIPLDKTLTALRCTCKKFLRLLEDKEVWTRTEYVGRSEFSFHVFSRFLKEACLRYIVSLDFVGMDDLEDHDLRTLLICCKRIKYIDISSCFRITDLTLDLLAKYPVQLRKLYIAKLPMLTAKLVLDVMHRHSATLEMLDLTGCQALTATLFKYPQKPTKGCHMPHLKYCSVGWPNNRPCDYSLLDGQLGQFSLIGLVHLDLAGSCVTEKSANIISKNCNRLRWLGLAGCDVDDCCLKKVCTKLGLLRHLDISNCHGFTANSLNLLTNLKQLRHLNISHCCQIEDSVFCEIICFLHKLEEILLRGCWNLTDCAFRCIADNCLQLFHLDASETKISRQSLLILSRGLSPLTVVTKRCPFIKCSRNQYL